MNQQITYKLSATSRDIVGKKVKKLRNEGLIPAVLYGRNISPESLSIPKREFEKIFEEAGTSALVDLSIDEKNSVKVLIHEPQLNPINESPLHIDLYKVRMDEKIRTEIPIEFIGESEAVSQLDGTLVTNRDNIEVECLPNDLIPNIEIDLDALKTFQDTITVADLKLPSTIEVLTESEEMIAYVEEPRSDEELAELDESAAEEEQEAIEKISGEEAEATEGSEEAGEDQSENEKE